jgi:diketogulonate reductase-like aldo/keto reductase
VAACHAHGCDPSHKTLMLTPTPPADVGRALRDSGLPRADVFVTTKIYRNSWGYDAARAAVQRSLRALGTECADG